MILNALELLGFRSYHAAACTFDPGINIIAGINAQGKTNLLEGVYYLSGARSFRTRTDRELIRLEENEAAIRGTWFPAAGNSSSTSTSAAGNGKKSS